MPEYLIWLWNKMMANHPEHANAKVCKSLDNEVLDYELENCENIEESYIYVYCKIAKDLFNIKIGLKGDGIFWI